MSPVTSSMAAETDINTKYQKLATEYAKLRSQVRLEEYKVKNKLEVIIYNYIGTYLSS